LNFDIVTIPDRIMSEAIKGPGMLWVTSRISKSAQDILDEETFLKWYDDDHIAEIVETDGIKDAFRYVDVEKGSPSVPKPFLAFYPMPDLAFTQGPGFKNIRVKSDILPGSGIVYDLADIDVSYIGLVGKTEAKAKTGNNPCESVHVKVSNSGRTGVPHSGLCDRAGY
jgi:hypothetical protein